MSESRYRMDLTPEQARVVQDALELFMRLQIGQFGQIIDLFRFGQDVHPENFPYIRDLLTEAKALLMPRTGSRSMDGGPSIMSPETPMAAKRACELYMALRHCVAWDQHPEGGITVNFDPPDVVSATDDPKPRVEVIKKEQA